MSDQRPLGNIRLCGMTSQRNGYGDTIDEESPLLDHENHLALSNICMIEGDGYHRNVRPHLDLTYDPNSNIAGAILSHPSRVWGVKSKILLACYVTFLLVMLPLGIFTGRHDWHPNRVFAVNLTAISLLTVVLEFATKQASLNLPDVPGSIIYALLGNIAELIIGTVALRNGQIDTVQSIMLGSILSSLLLFMGMCFFIGNILNMRDVLDTQGIQQSFSPIGVRTTRSLIVVSSAFLFLPTAFHFMFYPVDHESVRQATISLSRGISIILLLLYILYLILNLHTHTNIFIVDVSHYDEEAEDPIITLLPALTLLTVAACCVAVCASHLLNSIFQITHITKSFGTFILIPIMSNATGNVTAVIMAVRNKMDLAIRITTGSSIQIAFFVIPSLVMLGWTVGDEAMDLRYGYFQGLVYALSTLVVITSLTKRGTSNYLKGAMSLGMYTVVALAAAVNISYNRERVERVSQNIPS